MNILQDIIKRMAENSRNVKTWCITLVAALLALVAGSLDLPVFLLIMPILPLMFLDMYYLALETFYIGQYNNLIQNHKDGSIDELNVYNMEKPKGNLNIFFQFHSLAVWPFYSLLFILAGFVSFFLSFQYECLGS